jgi:carbon monoxide dehydrogenase subunit G
LHFEGVFEVSAPRDRVFALVTDPKQIGGCMPGLKKLEVTNDGEFDAVVGVGVSIIRGDVSMHFRTVEKVPPARVRMSAHGAGLGSAVDVDMATELAETPSGGTSMKWTAEATVSGRVASLGQGLVKSQAEKIIRELFDCIRGRLG